MEQVPKKSLSVRVPAEIVPAKPEFPRNRYLRAGRKSENMAAQHTEVAVHVGTPPPDFRDWCRTNIYYHGFADLPAERGVNNDMVTTQNVFNCGGFQFAVGLYPGGVNLEGLDEGITSIALMSCSRHPVNIEYGFSFKDSTGREVGGGASRTKQFGPYVDHIITEDNYDLVPNFAKRSTLLKSLVNGTLVVEFRMRPRDPTRPPPFIPENPSRCKIIQSMFMDKGSSDVVIEVDEQQAMENSMVIAKTSPVIFHAHLFILKKCSAPLYEMCN
jgi:hypothetical protein